MDLGFQKSGKMEKVDGLVINGVKLTPTNKGRNINLKGSWATLQNPQL